MTSYFSAQRRRDAGSGIGRRFGGEPAVNHVTLVAIFLLLVSPPTWSLPFRQRRSVSVSRKSIDQPEAELNDESFQQIGGSGNVDDRNLARERIYFQMEVDNESKTVVKATIGKTAVLECEAAGSPNPTVHWVRRGHRIVQGRHNQALASVLDDESTYESHGLRVSSTRSRLFIDCVQPSDAGVYECVAETPTKRITTTFLLQVGRHGHHKRHNAAAAVTPSDGLIKHSHHGHSVTGDKDSAECQNRGLIAAVEPARVYMWTIHRLELDGTNVQLYCRATGNPTPVITWYDKDDRQITADDPHYKLLPNGDLLIHAVSWSDMGLYRCVASNQAGTDAATAFFYPTTE